MSEIARKLKQYLLTGVSFAIPFVACGGILIAFAISMAPMVPGKGPDFAHAPVWVKTVLDIGVASFSLLVPVLAGYIAYGMADRPGLVPGFVGGWLATHLGKIEINGAPTEVSAGFLGGIVAGLLAGWLVMQIKKIRVPSYVRPIMPILVIPVFSSLVVGFVMLKVVGLPIADAMAAMTSWLGQMSSGSRAVLALVLGAMIAFDMGGPVNKVAFFFSAAMIERGNYAPMGACAVAICIPPIGLGLATLLARKYWSEQERESGIAALTMGAIGITEGAIPFAAADPLRVIPTIMAGSMVGAVIAMLGGVQDHAPHGGPIVLAVVDNRLMFAVAILAGSLTVALIINLLRAFSARRAAKKEVPAA